MQLHWKCKRRCKMDDIKELIKLLPKGFSIYVPKTKAEWAYLEKATLEVLYKVREEKRREKIAAGFSNQKNN